MSPLHQVDPWNNLELLLFNPKNNTEGLLPPPCCCRPGTCWSSGRCVSSLWCMGWIGHLEMVQYSIEQELLLNAIEHLLTFYDLQCNTWNSYTWNIQTKQQDNHAYYIILNISVQWYLQPCGCRSLMSWPMVSEVVDTWSGWMETLWWKPGPGRKTRLGNHQNQPVFFSDNLLVQFVYKYTYKYLQLEWYLVLQMTCSLLVCSICLYNL